MEPFADTFIPPGLDDLWFVARTCPACRAEHLRHVRALDESHWLCEGCGHCWRAEHGRLRNVDPLGCHGCPAHDKRECIALFQREFPSFAAGAATGMQDG